MASVTSKLIKNDIIHPPGFLKDAVCYEVIMGSVAYGVSSNNSDIDIYGFCIPKKEMIFPHLAGEILGFGRQNKRFEQYQETHKNFQDKEYDITIYNIVKYFNLCMENNPNMIDSLFVAREHVLFTTKVGEMVRENRHVFLHKGCWHKFKGYAYSQLHKIKNGRNAEGKRKKIIEKYGYDVKFGYHVVRLLDECEQILLTGDLDLRKNREHLKAIRRGDVPLEDIEKWFSDKEKTLERLYETSKLPHGPKCGKIKNLLVNCLEESFGDLSKIVPRKDSEYKEKIDKIIAIL